MLAATVACEDVTSGVECYSITGCQWADQSSIGLLTCGDDKGNCFSSSTKIAGPTINYCKKGYYWWAYTINDGRCVQCGTYPEGTTDDCIAAAKKTCSE